MGRESAIYTMQNLQLDLDEELIGCWRVKSCDMIESRVVHLIGGLPEEHVVFTSNGWYQMRGLGRPIQKKSASCRQRYRVGKSESFAELDFRIPGMSDASKKCIYCIEGDLLTICVAGNKGERPTELRRDDEQLWCVITMERSKFRQSRVQTDTDAGE